MRRLVVAAITALSAQSAFAADLPILRGSFSERPVVQRPLWQGFYVGGHATTGSTDADFTGANQTLTTNEFANTPLAGTAAVNWTQLNPRSAKSNGFGGFAGYNMQWDDVVVGVEGNYMHNGAGTSAIVTQTGQLIAGGSIIATTSQASLRLNDMGSMRVRGGWSWNGFLPYAFAGVGLGLGTYTQQVNATIDGLPLVRTPATPPPVNPIVQSNRLMYGYSVGLGLDMMLVAGLFARVEWEYTKLGSPQFATTLDPTVNTVRAGLGYKF